MDFTRLFRNAVETLGEALPRIGGALLLLVLGLLVARLAGRFARRALAALGVDELAERFRVHEVLARVGIERPLSRLMGRIVRLAISVVVVFAAVSLLGLAALSSSLNAVLLFLPKLFVALALVVAGAIVAQFVGDRVERLATQMALGPAVARIVQAAIFAIFLVTAIAQLGISTELLTALVGITFVAAALTVALAFGLGSREVARQVSAGRYVGTAFAVGQTITVDGIRGEIVALENAATVLRREDGQTLRVPNHLLLESVVALHDGAGETSSCEETET
ncbi:MAG: mechanosensitive ion channel [Actinomycetota bacterium]|nr:mechanosensitive ion channel [Actinomycetota bacterium]